MAHHQGMLSRGKGDNTGASKNQAIQ